MIDLHCHILPELDDGARSLRDSVAMARQAWEDGVMTVCATPHIRHDHDVRVHELRERVAALQAELDRLRIPVRVLTGGEVAQTAVNGLDEEELRLAAPLRLSTGAVPREMFTRPPPWGAWRPVRCPLLVRCPLPVRCPRSAPPAAPAGRL